MLQPISSVFLYFAQNWGYVVLLQSLCLIYNLSKVWLAVILIYFVPAAVVLPASLALLVHYSPPHNTAGRTSVLYSCIVVFFKVFCSLNILLIMPFIFK